MKTILRHTLRAASLALFAVTLSSCSGSGTEPLPDSPATLEELLFRISDRDILGGGYLPITTSSSMFDDYSSLGCAYDAVSKGFLCPTLSFPGMTMDHSFTLYDASGNPQSDFSRTTTASVRIKSHLMTTFGANGTSLTIEAADDRTVSGLLEARLVLNGTSTSAMNGVIAPSQSAGVLPTDVHSADTTVIANLLLPSQNRRWPGPGTITSRSTQKFDERGSRVFTRATFNGTKCVLIELSNGEFSTRATLDLSNPRATSCGA